MQKPNFSPFLDDSVTLFSYKATDRGCYKPDSFSSSTFPDILLKWSEIFMMADNRIYNL